MCQNFWPFLRVFVIFWIFLAIWGVQSGSRLGHNFKSQVQVLGTFSWGGGVWGVKTAYCGQDTTPYVLKPLMWKILVYSNGCLEKNLTFHHFRHTRTYLKLTVVSFFLFFNLPLSPVYGRWGQIYVLLCDNASMQLRTNNAKNRCTGLWTHTCKIVGARLPQNVGTISKRNYAELKV